MVERCDFLADGPGRYTRRPIEYIGLTDVYHLEQTDGSALRMYNPQEPQTSLL